MYVVVVVHVCKDKGLEDFWRHSVPDDMKQSFLCMCVPNLKDLPLQLKVVGLGKVRVQWYGLQHSYNLG